MNDSATQAIIALFLTSLIVRVLPVFLVHLFRTPAKLTKPDTPITTAQIAARQNVIQQKLSGSLPLAGNRVRNYLTEILPVAVFINFSVYIAWSEISKAPWPAVISLTAIGLMALSERLSLIPATLAGTGIYFLLRNNPMLTG
ncbi:hypothetical protein [Oceanospirillum sediminis]|uniref:Uncharacterized protein n=1 Tax=Oceanospirillum sediminis TaxID=2760088 RepID=A0A839IR42_9GAMM|nr:hypothetical protein [Oceanospirillum sediminis]MBB1487134.1 hypothetical protein [Oceanospirillum sediminis]